MAFNCIFFTWNIMSNLLQWIDDRRVIVSLVQVVASSKLQISRWSLLSRIHTYVIDLQVSLVVFTSLSFVHDTCWPRRKRIICYNVFSFFGHPGRDRGIETSRGIAICTERVMHTYRPTGRENRNGTLHRVRKVSTPARFIVFLLIPRLILHE